LICRYCENAKSKGILEIPNDQDSFICNSCNKTFIKKSILSGLRLWQKSIEDGDRLSIRTRSYIKSELFKYKGKNLDKINTLLNYLEDEIIGFLSIYCKDDLICVCLANRQRFRSAVDSVKMDNFWLYNYEYNIANILLSLIFKCDDARFQNMTIGIPADDGYHNLISAIAICRYYLLIKHNRDNISLFNKRNVKLDDYFDSVYESDSQAKFFEKYKISVKGEKPEDYKIANEKLLDKLKRERKDIESIELDASDIIKERFGFKLESAELLAKISLEFSVKISDRSAERFNFHYIICDRNYFYKRYFKEITKAEFDNLINHYSINSIQGLLPHHYDFGLYELRSIYQIGSILFFCRYDLFQNISTFRGYALSGHFIDMYSNDKGIINSFTTIQNRTSTYLCYVLADILLSKGYILPLELSARNYTVPMIEINKIMNCKVNILQNLGDIDIIAITPQNEKILNIEFKYYKPAVTTKQILVDDKAKIENKDVYKKISARESAIKDNLETVIRFLGGNPTVEYVVESILVTSRPNFFVSLGHETIKCFFWDEFISGL
jgi:hypothetical protein